MKLKEVHEAHWESLCVLYLYYYPIASEESSISSGPSIKVKELSMDPDLPRPAAVVPEVPADPAVDEMEVD